MCGGSPLFYLRLLVYVFCFSFQMSGRLHRGEYFIYSRSPLSEPEFVVEFLLLVRVGEITQGRECSFNSRSPLCLFVVCLFYVNGFSCRGEYTGRRIF